MYLGWTTPEQRPPPPVDKIVALASTELPPRRPGEELEIASSFLDVAKRLQGRVASDSKELGVDVSTELLDLRSVKEEWELELMREALKITERAFLRLGEMRLVGLRERDVAALVYKWFMEEGADGVAFDPIVASGPNGAFPHYRFGDRKITQGDLVVVDIGAKKDVYCSDMTRTLLMGNPGPVLKDAVYAVYEAVKAAEKAVREGARPQMWTRRRETSSESTALPTTSSTPRGTASALKYTSPHGSMPRLKRS